MGAPVATLIGHPGSPFVRKVLAACAFKNLEVAVDPIVAFIGNDEFAELSPLRRIPVWIDEEVVIPDSSAILQYLEERWPEPSLLPATPAGRARCRWLEEYADTRLADVLVWKLYFQVVVKPFVLGEAPDEALVAQARDEEVPEVFDFLERQLPEAGFLFGAPSIADLTLAAHFANARWAGVEPDPVRWPHLNAWLERVHTQTPLGALNRAAARLMKVPPPEQREILPRLGLIPSARSWAGGPPRRGPMSPR